MKIIKCQPYDIQIKDCCINDKGEEYTELRFWCLNKKNKSVLLRVCNFPVFCHIELPLIDASFNVIRWNNLQASNFVSSLCESLKNFNIDIGKWNYRTLKKLYYYNEKNYPFVLLTFKTLKDMFKAERICKKIVVKGFGEMKINFYETRISVVNKLLSMRNIGTSQKLKCVGEKPEDKISTSKEFIVDYRTMTPLEEDWITCPLLCAFDIEAYSHNHRSFPNKYNYEDVVFSISLVFQRDLSEEKEIFCVLIGETRHTEGVTTITVKDEFELIDKFCDLIKEKNPDVLIGYNIFGFDYDYLNERLHQQPGVEWKNIGRLLDGDCYLDGREWSSSAYGIVNLKYLNMDGRISIDLYPFIKRDYKLSIYTLNAVSKFFLGETKTDLKYHEMFDIYYRIKNNPDEKAIEDNTRMVEYNIQDSLLCIKLFEKLNVWISLLELSSIVKVTPMDFFTRGQQVRCIAQLYDKSSSEGYVLTNRIKDYTYFNGGKVEEPIPGFWELVLCFDFNSLYPSIMMAYNICFTTLVKKMDEVDEKDMNIFEIDQEEPLHVEPPQRDNFDFEEYAEDEYDLLDAQEKKMKIEKHYKFGFVKKEVRKGLLPSILEVLIENRGKVKKEMKELEKTINETEGPPKRLFEMRMRYKMLDARQKGLKVSANSMYGFLGAQIRGKFSLIEGSMCVTSRGRELITQSSEFFEEHFGGVTVYGDTDSCMIHIPNLQPRDAWNFGVEMEKKINGGVFPHPLKLELEKLMRAVFIKKKKYLYYEYDNVGDVVKQKNSPIYNLNARGVILARRDNCKWVRDVYEDVARKILEGKTIQDVFETIVKSIIKIIKLKIDVDEDLAIARSVGSNYKAKSYFLNLFSENMKKIGRPLKEGERVKFIVVNDAEERTKIGYKMRTVELFNECWEFCGLKYGEKCSPDFKPPEGLTYPETIDSLYYIEKMLMRPIDQLFEYGFMRIMDKYEHFGYQPIVRNSLRVHSVSVRTPTKMIVQIIKDYQEEALPDNLKIIIPILKNMMRDFKELPDAL